MPSAAITEFDGPGSAPVVTAPHAPPDSLESRFVGKLTFHDGYPTSETIQRIYDELDFQRATQVMLRNIAALNMHAFRLGMARDLGIDSCSQLGLFRATALSLLLTPNSETLYGITFLALDRDGATVVEVPPGVLGLVDDMWMRPVEDIGPAGPDQGKGGKYLFVPPGIYDVIPPSDHYCIRMQTYGGWVLLRAFLDPSGDEAPAQALLRQVKIYPYSKRKAPPAMRFVEATGKSFDTTPPNDIRYFEMLADLMSREHQRAVGPDVSGMMKAIGIEKGKPFAPDARLKPILDEAAHVGSYMAQAISYAPRNPELMRPGSKWFAGLEGYPTFSDGVRTLMDPLIRMAWFAAGTAKAMAAPKPGTGSQYIWTFQDGAGQWLQGENSYRFRIPADPPAKDFWSMVIYDNWTRAILSNGQQVASKNSYDKSLQANDDGSIDLYFGPEAPIGQESNWVRTEPGKGWFAIFRLYGPLQPWFDRTWTPDDIIQTGGSSS
jgi:hypothetical protein